ncbi:DNA replication/repair protein RecF [Alteromonas sp. ASW11-19]|uniref:DNA replication and repair protein RecF n=1 Tax=Alteromonas salexigens TaxID=2982530 RepID=A0ABT2VKP8_9ALTE|nr:DNA replication/repair protein RecF [Alteromonas salexigens]MCU7553620.1 DNA replication/repair protein RecF [Alteromonas salexigens]
MKLDEVQLTNFRNISQVTLRPSPRLTVVSGVNGSGKSSLLEGLYYLGYGRSFRTKKHQSVIAHEQQGFSVFARCVDEQGTEIKVGLERNRHDEFTCSIDGTHSTRLSDLVSKIPIQLFTPQSTDLILGSPSERRRFCDWGLFHVEHDFHLLSQQYQKLLRHRNALLKQQANLAAPEHQYWESQFDTVANHITAKRQVYVDKLTPIFEQFLAGFLPEFTVTVSYYKGWEKDATLSGSLVKKAEYDGKIGHTSVGPHKADIRFKLNGANAQEILSRGQLRMAVAALQLAQTALFSDLTAKKSIFLLDDVGAELDIDKRERFIDGLLDMDTQVFVTAIERSQLNFINKYNDKRMFHVEHGHVTEE